MKKLTLLLCSFALAFTVYAKETDPEEPKKRKYVTQKLQSPILLDGVLDDTAWEQVKWDGEFTQLQPQEGEAPSQDTKFKIIYDQKFLYIGIRCYDTEPDKIVKRMSRRDGFEGDWVEINIDSYNDKRTAFSFTISASGVRGDEAISNNGNNWDSSWDPIWRARTNIDEEGWTAEMQIPFSQLRFADKEKHVWGMQFTRRLFRKEERSNWQFIPQNAPGWVHLFGELHGIEGVKPKKTVEIQPYVVAQAETYEKQEGNPFATGRETKLNYGLDGKVGITNDVTLDFTINPDFGQVEADPSQVNLSAFQVFFREQRPFFVEGSNILNFQVTGSEAGGSFNRDNLFYSRRIGRRPRGSVSTIDGDYTDFPDNSRIIGAAKVTGKNKNGLSFGVLESVTAREVAVIDREGNRMEQEVEPLTNFFVARAQQDFDEGKTVIGGMFTAVNRDIEEGSSLDFLHKEAYTGGFDILHNFKNRDYYFSFNGVMSTVKGSQEAILNTQTSGEHFFQRPNATHVSVDSSLTSLTGTGGTFKLGKNSGKLVFQTGGTWRSPELEMNDAGFMRTADQINQWTWVGYRAIQKQKGIFRSLRLNFNQYLQWDFSGTNTSRAVNINTHAQFTNMWRFGTGFNLEDRFISNANLRGGPSMIMPGGLNNWFYIGTNNQKKFQLSFNHWNYWGFENYNRSKGYSFNITYRPFDALNVSLSPSISYNDDELQYVTTNEFEGENRYILGLIDQSTYSMRIRLNYSIKPNLSIQYYGQPFISKGEYSNFKRATNPSAGEISNRFHQFNNEEISYNLENSQYQIDENRDGTVDYSIGNPDFNFVQYRSNLVVRWEYIPGSTLFLVWAENRTNSIDLGEPNSFGQLSRGLFNTIPHDIFLVKLTYRFVR